MTSILLTQRTASWEPLRLRLLPRTAIGNNHEENQFKSKLVLSDCRISANVLPYSSNFPEDTNSFAKSIWLETAKPTSPFFDCVFYPVNIGNEFLSKAFHYQESMKQHPLLHFHIKSLCNHAEFDIPPCVLIETDNRTALEEIVTLFSKFVNECVANHVSKIGCQKMKPINQFVILV